MSFKIHNDNRNTSLSSQNKIQGINTPGNGSQSFTNVLISCYSDTISPPTMPVGFNWTNILSTTEPYMNMYYVTLLLHGATLKYGLNNSTYFSTYGTNNPFLTFLTSLMANFRVSVKICELCLTKDGFNDNQIIPGIIPVNFSISYIIQSTAQGYIIINDSPPAN